MSAIKYNKLIRDNIPEIIRASGKECVVRAMDDGDFLKMADLKLTEELEEYLESGSVEELADLMEVIYAAAEARGTTPSELEEIRKVKAERNGTFKKKLLLTAVRGE